MKEIWKDVVGYEGLYKVSNFGNVWSFGRAKKIGRNFSPRLLKPNLQGTGSGGYKRYRVALTDLSGNTRSYKVHRLVALAFIPNSDNKPNINHIDCNPLNNKVDNLEWVTTKENVAWAVLKSKMNQGEKNGNYKFTDSDISEIKEMCKTKSVIDVSKIYNISFQYIYDILSGKARKYHKN